MTLIEAKDLYIKLGKTVILSNINFSIQPKEIVTIVGPNGAGKSTFLRSLIGSVQPETGRIITKPGLRIGYVPQRLQIDQNLPLSVDRFLNLPHRAESKFLDDALNFSAAAGLLNRSMSALSGGELQRVLLARALLNRPELLILDEATQGLDHPASVAFYRQIETVCKALECGVLMVSHELHVVMAASHRVICLNRHICCQGSPEQVASSSEYKALFGSEDQGAMAIYKHVHDHSHDFGRSHDSGREPRENNNNNNDQNYGRGDGIS